MMKKLVYIFLAVLLPFTAYADEQSPYGPWECVMAGNEGIASVNIDPANHVFAMKLPVGGGNFNFLFQTFITDGDKTGIILLTPDHIAHPVDLVKTADGISIDFYDIKEVPALQCKRPTEKAFIGH